MNQNELYHYGIKGMKWGVRRDRKNTGYNRKHDFRKNLRELRGLEGKDGYFNDRKATKLQKKLSKEISNYENLMQVKGRLKAYSDWANKVADKRYASYVKNINKAGIKDYERFKKTGKTKVLDYPYDMIDSKRTEKERRDYYLEAYSAYDYGQYGYEKYCKKKKWDDVLDDPGWEKARQDFRVEADKAINDLLGKYGNNKYSKKRNDTAKSYLDEFIRKYEGGQYLYY